MWKRASPARERPPWLPPSDAPNRSRSRSTSSSSKGQQPHAHLHVGKRVRSGKEPEDFVHCCYHHGSEHAAEEDDWVTRPPANKTVVALKRAAAFRTCRWQRLALTVWHMLVIDLCSAADLKGKSGARASVRDDLDVATRHWV